ncbi:MAG: tRNA pseudouridine(55) synthase TruB, partial [Mariprofundales bacterium]|nr:tRNA pseudouridine(55) synthase TruB [Mariprofundales bacterium]
RAVIEEQLRALIGDIEQVPPLYSAIRIDGRRSHELARSGNPVELPARSVVVHSIDIIDYSLPILTLKVHSSKGTYMRSLARDLGTALGVGGAVVGLRRVQSGGWDDSLMVTIEQVKRGGSSVLHPVGFWLRHLPAVELTKRDALRLLQGQRVANASFVVQECVAIFCGDSCLGIGKVAAGHGGCAVLHPKRLIPNEVMVD